MFKSGFTRAFVVVALLIAATMIISPLISGSRQASGQAKDQEMEQKMEMMAPMMGQMMTGMMEGFLNLLAKPETSEKLATFTRNYYDALIGKGFTKEEALNLVASMGIPSLSASR